MNFLPLISLSFSNQVHREGNFNLDFILNENESIKCMDKETLVCGQCRFQIMLSEEKKNSNMPE